MNAVRHTLIAPPPPATATHRGVHRSAAGGSLPDPSHLPAGGLAGPPGCSAPRECCAPPETPPSSPHPPAPARAAAAQLAACSAPPGSARVSRDSH